jgi:hypothetical protein
MGSASVVMLMELLLNIKMSLTLNVIRATVLSLVTDSEMQYLVTISGENLISVGLAAMLTMPKEIYRTDQ